MKCIQNRVSLAVSKSQALRRSVCIALTLSLLVTSTPAAPKTIVGLANETSVSFAFWFKASGWRKSAAQLIQGHDSNGEGQQKQPDRDAKVARIEIFPGDVTIDLNEQIRFAAIAYDQDNSPVGGVQIKWSGKDTNSGRRARILPDGEFEAIAPGSFNIMAEGAGKTAAVTIVVRPGIRRNFTTAATSIRQVSTRDLPPAVVAKTESLQESTGPRSKKSASNAKRGGVLKAHTRSAKSSPVIKPSSIPPLVPPALQNGWSDDNYWSADDPGNQVGDPPGSAMDEGAGSGNFQLTAPVLGLPGRGTNIMLRLAYNSRLWNKAGSQISFDNDRGWPAPGWSLGFGKIQGMGASSGAMIVDADGTRHSFGGTLTQFSSGTSFAGHTSDGTFIDYSCNSNTSGVLLSGTAKLPTGTVISYGAPGAGAVYPTTIKDQNGNFLTITYVNNSGPRISTIVDTLNRPVMFHYDASNLLTAITGPGLNGATRTLVRITYRQIFLNYSFSGLIPVVSDPAPWVVNAIYYPATNTGYWFGDADSYSSYGMLAKVSERRNMSFAAASLNDQGTVTGTGLITREGLYSYPLTPSHSGGSGLTDAPTYPSLTDRWTRDGVNVDEAVTNYSSQPNASPRTVTVTLPNGAKSVQFSHNAPGTFRDGLVYQDQTLDSSNNVLQSSTVTWAQGAYESPRPARVEATNELSQMIATEFLYGSNYNQVTEVKNFGYGGTSLLQVTRTQYQNSANYTQRHIFNLPLVVEVFAADGTTRVSRTEYQYDGQPLVARPDVVRHDPSFNPHAEAEGHCFVILDPNDPDCTGNCLFSPVFPQCDGICSEIFHCPYNSATDYRGNLTQTTTYADAINLTGAVTKTRRYDITGNLVTAGEACCEQTSFNYTVDTQYAYPLSQTRGSATDPLAQITTSTTYDFNTGLVLSMTDANGRASQTSYFPTSLRAQTTTMPTGAHTDYEYDDTAMSVTETTYLESHPAHTTIAQQHTKLLNGRGQLRQEKALGAGNVWDFVDVGYDEMGRVSQQSRPYRTGDTIRWSTHVYDALGRVIRIQSPDGSATQTFYNESARPAAASSAPGETMRLRDAWGRERWGRTDAQKRLVEVIEPGPSGSGSVFDPGALVTTYTYNTLGNLLATNQNAQTRSFRYDALGRLTAQKLAETNATLNDAGQYVGSGTWGEVFAYDERSNLVSRTDARGVRTVYNYNSDPLNRLQSVSWNTSGFGDTSNPILPAATVTYQYRTKSSGSQRLDITQLHTVTTAGVSAEGYIYDAEGRVSSKSLIFSNRPSNAFVTDYIYDDLDRVEDMRFPAEYGNGTQPRKVVHHSYDVASRLTSLGVDGALHASNIAYNADSQTTSVGVGAAGPNQVIESYDYDQQTGLLTNQTLARSSAPANWLLNLSYDYAGTDGKRTGQLVKLSDNLNHNKDVSYSYDALGRLAQAKGGPSSAPLWTQTYGYDRYGNRTSTSATGFSASLNQPNSRPATARPATARVDQQSVNTSSDRTQSLLNSHHAPRSTPAALSTQGGPPVFTDPDLLAPGVTVKALHITELRTAINDLRARLGQSPFSWQTSLAGFINASPILELRTALDQVLGPPAGPGYSPGLSQSQPVLAIHIQELRNRVIAVWTTTTQIPVDGHGNLAYDQTTNRITTAGFEYDKAGNQVRALIPGGAGSQRFQYDAANRLAKVKADDNVTVLASYTYADSNERLITEEAGVRTYYACDGNAEYTESVSATTLQWAKSYIYLGARLLSTLTPNGSGGELVQYHHPDRVGTGLVTNAQDTNYFKQATLPFGTSLGAQSIGATNRRFTTYDRSAATGLDYAVNRHYDSQQGRFTQVDPAGMHATNLDDPQTLNLYAYCTNDPVNNIDPSGLGLFSFFKKLFKWVVVAITVALAVVTIIAAPYLTINVVQAVFAIISAVASAISTVLNAVGLTKAASIFGFISAIASLGASIVGVAVTANPKTILKLISEAATLASKVLTQLGYTKLGQIFELVGSTANTLSGKIKIDDAGKAKLDMSLWDAFKLVRGTLEKVATIVGATRIAGFLNTIGMVGDVLHEGVNQVNRLLNGPSSEQSNDLNTPIKRFGQVVEVSESTRRLLRWHRRLTALRGLVGNINTSFGRSESAPAPAR
ncbi:MAG TPA: RHS repeat-associated core domain-containing protein [Pyrinomonadaceae bacterium]|nr:RHS repeat-associated core domain-containing protein [Pyrinomonadaceae bacterium]